METTLGIIAGILTSGAMVPQLIKVIKEKEVENLSKGTIFVLIIGVSLWVVYGIILEDLPIIISNSFSVIVNCILLFCIFRYREK